MNESRAILLAFTVGTLLAPTTAQGDEIQFNRDIRPILTENCYHCHGPDPGSRKEGLRLDRVEGLLEKRDTGMPVVPGNPDKSTLIERVFTDDRDEVMPPPKSKKKLTAREKDLLKQWVAQGARWEPHWSFIAPKRAAPPEVKGSAWVRNSIDNFILAKLEANGLTPAPEADRRALARRLSLDLVGLPPVPEDVEKFVKNQSPTAYEELVNLLLSSPHYGEHRARYWLDAARYADTHGLHFDNYREMWPYRDWVINAFNRNQPFDKFTIDQLAGDLLPNATLDQQVASGFHRCNITTNEGGTIDEETLANYARDRVETTGTVFLGLTLGCAVCHEHKFDPITQKEFYQFTAFFRNTTQAAKDNNVADTKPVVLVPGEKDAARWNALPREIDGVKSRIAAREKEVEPQLSAWSQQLRPEAFDHPVGTERLELFLPLRTGSGQAVWNEATRFGAKVELPDAVEWKLDAKPGPYIEIKDKATIELRGFGDVERDDSFSYGAWIKPNDKTPNATVISRMDGANASRGWDLSVFNGKVVAAHIVSRWPDNAIKVSTQPNAGLKPGQWNHVFVTYDGSGNAAGVSIYVNGGAAKLGVDSNNLKGSIRTEAPGRIGSRGTDWFFAGGGIHEVRFYRRKLEGAEVRRHFDAAELRTLAASTEKRTPGLAKRLQEYYYAAYEPAFDGFRKDLAKLEAEQKEIRARNPVTHVMRERETPPKAFVLKRGQYDQKGEEVEPAILAALNKMPDGAPKNRLGLARWIVAPENPLTARVVVNRFWQEIFGAGIVRTSEDFGIMGAPPSHPEMLDWLSVEFRESGWDVKKLVKLIVTSAAYRQASVATKDKIAADPSNRLLSRGPRFRMDAEAVRDYALAASGLLAPRLGGPSVKPYQPDGVWEAVAMNVSNTREYKRDTGDKLYRRSLYTFWKRSAPPASMDIFNAPSREAFCVRRERTNTPLQALVTLNDTQFVEAARRIAERALKEGGPTTENRLDFIAQRLLARPLRAEELTIVQGSLENLSGYYRSHEDDARKLIAVGESKPDDKLPPAELAAWTMTANGMFNLDEVLNK